MKNRYRTIFKRGKDEIIINKSRFIGYAAPITSEEDAINFIEEIKSIHKDATHNVYGYVLGENSTIQRYSDDGEPSGTAGIPVLEVIKKEELKDIVVVVTRYFGGIKLGTGGLIRAYTKGAKIGLEAANIVDRILFKKIKIRIDYTLYGKIENELINKDYIIQDIIFDDKVNLIVFCEIDTIDYFKKMIDDLSSGKACYEELEDEYLDFKDGKRIV